MPDRVVVRLPNWLGDTVMAVPSLRALRAAYPRARVLAAGPWVAILAGQGLADVLVAYPRTWAARLRAADTVREFRPDLAVLLPNSFEAALAARYWGAARRVGFATSGRAWLLTDAPLLPEPRRHQVDEYASVVECLGVDVIERQPVLEPPPVDSDQRQRARALLAGAGALRGDARPTVGIHLGAAYGSSKLWPASGIVDLVRELRRQDVTVVLLGPRESVAIAAEVTRAVDVPSLVGLDTPDVLSGVVAEVGVLVGGDTGVTHLAGALGAAVVALFGPTDPRLSAPRGRTAVVTHPVACSPCFYRECPIDHPCMRGIAAGDVATHVRSLLGQGVGS
jgi:heptosyltransferase-2